MHATIIQRLVKGFSANVYGQAVSVCIQLFGVPILLHFWGPRLYGEWLILSAVPVYLSISDLGFAQSAGNDMTQKVARGDREGALSVFQSIGALIALCSLSGLTVVIILLTATPIPDLFPVQLLSPREAAWVVGLLAADVLILINEGTIHAGFRANGGYALHTVFHSSTILAQNALLWISATAGRGPIAGAGAFLLVRLLATPLAAIMLVRTYDWITIGVSHIRWQDLHRLFRPAIANSAFPLTQSLNIQGMRLVVGTTIGPIAVVIFTTLRTLTRLILQASATIGHASEPEMAAAYGSGDILLLRRLYIHTTRLTIVITLGLVLILYWASNWILAFWTHGTVAMDSRLFCWLLASAVAGTFWYGSLIVLKAANRHLGAAIFSLITAGLTLILAYGMLTHSGRLSEAGFALMLMDASVAVYVIPIACRLSGEGWQQFLRQLFNACPIEARPNDQ
jgi:O-antigen/teichoic acid export membrane protein